MKFGVFDHMDDAGLPLGQLYADRLQLVEAYDRAGLRGYHLAEHHSTPLGCAASPGLFLAAAAQRTRTLRFGPLVYLLPFYHPLRLIEEICMLDQMSGGRLELGVGRGVSPFETKAYGLDFATTGEIGKMKYGSDIVTIYADKTVPGGLASCAWDDDGVATQRWDLLKDGVLVGVQTTRDQAPWIGEKASRGTSYAQDHASVPFQRMPNVSLAPSAKDIKLADIVGATDDGVLITGNGSWSIDHQRYNFQFGGQMFYEVKGGKITRSLRDVAYQSNSLEFWSSCDMIGGEPSWELHGSLHDGKGEPSQSNSVSHGCPPARFKRVDILDVNTRAKT